MLWVYRLGCLVYNCKHLNWNASKYNLLSVKVEDKHTQYVYTCKPYVACARPRPTKPWRIMWEKTNYKHLTLLSTSSLSHIQNTHTQTHIHTQTRAHSLSLSQFLTPSLIHYIPLSFFSKTFYFLFSRHFPIFVNHLVQQTQVKVCQCFSTFLNLKSFWLQDVVKGFDPPSLSGILAVSYMKLIFNI